MSEQGEALDAEIDRCVQAACNHEPGVDCRECYIRGLVRRLGARVGRLSRQVEELEAALEAADRLAELCEGEVAKMIDDKGLYPSINLAEALANYRARRGT